MKNLHWKGDRFFLGLTGLPGSGKSAARSILEKLGCRALDADALAHEVLDEPDTMDALKIIFGEEVLEDGKVDRAAIAKRVFGNKDLLQRLNNLVHPRVRELARERMNSFPEGSIVVYDVPLLFEGGLEKEMDASLVIDASFPTRLKRVESRNWTEEQLRSRDQHHFQDKPDRADFVISNEKTLDELERQLQDLLKNIEAAKK